MHKPSLIVLVSVFLVGFPAWSQGKGAPKPPPKASAAAHKGKAATGTVAPKGAKKANKAQSDSAGVRDAIFKLRSPSPEEVLTSIQIIAASGARDAVGPLTDLLRSGPRNDVTNAAIQALGSIGGRGAVDVLIEYLGHRRPDARVAAIFALEGIDDDRVNKALEESLRDSDAGVRSTAALTLGKRKAKGSLPILFHAFDRGVYDAAVAIGQIGSPQDAGKLADYLGKVDVKVLLPGFDEFLHRPELPKQDKGNILDRLFELAGPEVRRFLIAYKGSFPPGTDEDNDELFKKVSRMVRQIQEE